MPRTNVASAGSTSSRSCAMPPFARNRSRTASAFSSRALRTSSVVSPGFGPSPATPPIRCGSRPGPACGMPPLAHPRSRSSPSRSRSVARSGERPAAPRRAPSCAGTSPCPASRATRGGTGTGGARPRRRRPRGCARSAPRRSTRPPTRAGSPVGDPVPVHAVDGRAVGVTVGEAAAAATARDARRRVRFDASQPRHPLPSWLRRALMSSPLRLLL